MKISLLLLASIALSTSCRKTDVSMFNKPCTDSCMMVQGRFITGNNEGVVNIPFEIHAEYPVVIFRPNPKKIASGKTDNNGYYSVKFGLLPQEYGPMANLHFVLYFNYDTSKFLSVSWYKNYGTGDLLGNFSRKDTTITANIFLASRSKLKVKLENFYPVQPGDNFLVITSCGVGLDRSKNCGGYFEANKPIQEQEMDACGNEPTTVIVEKRKNGISTTSTTTIMVPTGQTVAQTFAY